MAISLSNSGETTSARIKKKINKYVSYHLTTVRMDIIKNQEIKSVGEDAKKRKSVHRW